MTSIAYVGSVTFEQDAYKSMDAHCAQCDWAQPWDGRAMIEHAATHGQELGDQCLECAIATLNAGLPARCDEHEIRQ